jgi:hypothetical protein
VTTTRPVRAAAKMSAGGAPPTVEAVPRVNSEEPAFLNDSVTPLLANGHSSRVRPMKTIPSQAKSCVIRMAAAWLASIRSRRRYSAICLVTREYAVMTTRSTTWVSRLFAKRGTTSVPITLCQTVSTSNAPQAAATHRAASGTTMDSSPLSTDAFPQA